MYFFYFIVYIMIVALNLKQYPISNTVPVNRYHISVVFQTLVAIIRESPRWLFVFRPILAKIKHVTFFIFNFSPFVRYALNFYELLIVSIRGFEKVKQTWSKLIIFQIRTKTSQIFFIFFSHGRPYPWQMYELWSRVGWKFKLVLLQHKLGAFYFFNGDFFSQSTIANAQCFLFWCIKEIEKKN